MVTFTKGHGGHGLAAGNSNFYPVARTFWWGRSSSGSVVGSGQKKLPPISSKYVEADFQKYSHTDFRKKGCHWHHRHFYRMPQSGEWKLVRLFGQARLPSAAIAAPDNCSHSPSLNNGYFYELQNWGSNAKCFLDWLLFSYGYFLEFTFLIATIVGCFLFCSDNGFFYEFEMLRD